jgi:hypothetical protein
MLFSPSRHYSFIQWKELFNGNLKNLVCVVWFILCIDTYVPFLIIREGFSSIRSF